MTCPNVFKKRNYVYDTNLTPSSVSVTVLKTAVNSLQMVKKYLKFPVKYDN